MKEKKNKHILVIIIILLFIIGGVVFATNKFGVSSNKITNTEKNKNIEDAAKQLYKDIVEPILYRGIWAGNIETFSFEDVSAVIDGVAKEEDYVQNLCGTELEKELIKEGLITSKDSPGQFMCDTSYLMTVATFNELTKNVFGKDFKASLESVDSFWYSKKNQLVRVFWAGANDMSLNYNGYDIDGNYLTVKAVDKGQTNDKNDNYLVKFKIDGNNYYLYEVKSSFTELNAEIKMTLGTPYSKTDITNFILDYNDENKIEVSKVKFIEVDIDEDGNKDLIATNGDDVSEADAIGFFFKNDGSNYIYIGSSRLVHSTFSKEAGKPYINKLTAHMNEWILYKGSIKSNELKFEEINSGTLNATEKYPNLLGEDLKVRK